MKCILLFTSLISFGSVANAQQYISKMIYLSDSLNLALTGKDSPSIQEMLIDGFRSGKLVAYTYHYIKEPIYGESIAWPLPKPWSRERVYFNNDSVVHKGKLFKYLPYREGIIFEPDTSKLNDYWIEYKRIPPIKSYRYLFPSQSDIMSISEWEKIKFDNREIVREWNSTFDYFVSEKVLYQGKVYYSDENGNKNNNPVTGKKGVWLFEGDGTPADSYFANAEVLFDEISKEIIVFSLSYNKGSIGFYFKDIVSYLNSIDQKIQMAFLKHLNSSK